MRLPAVKRLALFSVAKGIRLPDNPLNRYQELWYLSRLLRSLSINCVIDVGANTGQFAGELRATGYRGFVCSFEPVERAFVALEAQFAGDSRWRGYRMALGAEDAQMTLHVDPNHTDLSSLLAPRDEWQNVEEERVEVRRLDGIFDEIVAPVPQPRVFLKIDAQGYDLRVFEGAAGCIGQIRGLQSELSVVPLYEGMPTYLEALSAYQKAGFDLFNISVVERELTDGLLELNCFMKQSGQSDS